MPDDTPDVPHGGHKTFLCDEAIPIYSRVKLDADGRVTIAGNMDIDIGTATRATFAAGELLAVKLRTAPGTHKMRVGGPITTGDLVYIETDGEVNAMPTQLLGTSLTSGVVGEFIEVVYNAHGDTAVA